MDRKTKLILALLLTAVFIVGFFLIRNLTRIVSPVPETADPSGPAPADSPIPQPDTGPVDTHEPSDGSWISYGTFSLPADYEELKVRTPNMYQVTGYHSEHIVQIGGKLSEQTFEEIARPDYEYFSSEDHKVEGLFTFAGQQVYFESKEEAMELDKGKEDTTHNTVNYEDMYYYFNGDHRTGSNADGYVYNIRDLREEGTGMRIYVLEQEYIDQFAREWQEGQKVLSGERPAEEGMIIVNGRLLEDCRFVRNAVEEIMLPMKAVGRAVDVNLYREDEESLTIYVPVRSGTASHLQAIPYTVNASNLYTGLGFIPNRTLDSTMVSYGVEDNCYCWAQEVCQFTGYRVFTNGTVVVVVSDDVDWNNNFILDTRKPLSYEEQFEMYGEATIYEDLDDPAFIEWYERDPDEENGG